MNDRQRAKLNSAHAVRATLDKTNHRALWSSLPAFLELHDRFVAQVALIEATALIQSGDRTGITKAKNEARESLEASTLKLAGALTAYAFLINDEPLRAKASFPPSTLERLPDAEVDDRAIELVTTARALLTNPPATGKPQLADFGINPATLDELDTRIETYNLLLGTPRAARGERTAATQNLQQALEDLDELLNYGLDTLIRQFNGTTLEKEYTSARALIDPASTPEKPPTSPTT